MFLGTFFCLSKSYLPQTEEEIGRKITPHYFRHRYFTECGKANLPIADVKAISGIKYIQVPLEFFTQHSRRTG